MCRFVVVFEIAFRSRLSSGVSENLTVSSLTNSLFFYRMVTKEDFDLDAITTVVKENVENAKLTRSHGQEVSYTLPLEDVSSFPSQYTL